MKIYVVATPIGNLSDITARALEVFGSVGVVFAEDTRMAGKLFMHFEVRPSVMRFDENSSASDIERLLTVLEERETAALVTDAGTPGISDPAFRLIEAAVKKFGNKCEVIPIPGPSALTAALSIAHFPVQPFTFFGFPPHKKGREKFFNEVCAVPNAVVFYESVHRFEKCLEALVARAPERECLVARELTKLYEQVVRGRVSEVAKNMNQVPRGEYVIILAPQEYGK